MTKTYVRTDHNGTKYYIETVKCDRCGGDGVYKWGAMISYFGAPAQPQFAGTCFKCGGSGVVEVETKEYTPEYRAKLDAANAKRSAKKEAERAEQIRERERKEAERKTEAEQKEMTRREQRAKSQYIGTVGEKIETDVTISWHHTYDARDYFGRPCTRDMWTFLDKDGNAFIWYTDCGLGDWDRETVYHLTGTVKKHQEYDGQKQTVLTRVKVVEKRGAK